MNIVGLSRYVLSTFVATALLAGCGGSQTQIGGPGARPQSAALTMHSSQNIAGMVPDVACPVAGGKTYKTGNGHVSMKFWPVETTAPSRESWGVYLVYTGWKQGRPLVLYTTKLLTCGPQGDKKPIGELGKCCGGSTQSKCHSGFCTDTLKLYVDYKIAGNLPGKKPWKFDYVKFVPEKKVAGFGALPALRIQVNP
jgi:hypothetical protein